MSSPNSAEISGSPSPAPSSIGNNAPKYGTLVPNRIFVGGISGSTTEQDLLELFSQYGAVKATKIISDRAGVSKGYGFVTFETEDEARRLTQEADNIMLKDRKLNIAPAIKKQVSDVGYMKTYSPRLVESNGSMVGAGGTVFFGNGATYSTYGNSVPVIGPAEYHPSFSQAPAAAAAAAAAAAPPPAPSAYQTIVYQQPMYYTTQQYQYQPTQTVQAQWGAVPQWRWVTPASYPQQATGSYISSEGMYTQGSPTYIVPDRTYCVITLPNIPECSSQCLVEPSSSIIAQRDHTTITVGSTIDASSSSSSSPSPPPPLPPPPSTQVVITTTPSSSTSVSSIATTTTTTSSTTTPCISTSTSSATEVSATSCDSLLLIKPLSGNKRPPLANGKGKVLPILVAKEVDSNNNSPEGTKKAPLPTSTQISHTVTSDCDPSSPDHASQLSSSISASNGNDFSMSIANQNSAVEENAHGDNSEAQIPFQHCLFKAPAKAFSDGDVYATLNPELLCVADTACNSSNRMLHGSEGLDPNSGGLESPPPPLSSGVHSYGTLPPTVVRHNSSCPHYTGGEVVAGPRSLYPHSVSSSLSPVILIPSWMPLGKQGGTISPMFDLTSKLVTGKVNHTERSQVSPPSPALQPHSASHTTAIPTSLLTTSPEISKPPLASCLVTSSKGSTACVIDGKGCTSVTTCITNTTATLVSTTSTVASSLQNICSTTTSQSAWHPWQQSGSFAPSFPGSTVAPSLYRYTNQGVWVIVPSYPYYRTGIPCYQWPTPVTTHWPVHPPSSVYYTAPSVNLNRPSYGGTLSGPSSAFSDSVSGSSRYSNFYPKDRYKYKEGTMSGYEHSKHYDKKTRSSHTGEYNGTDGNFTMRTSNQASVFKGKSGDYTAQKKSKSQRACKPGPHQNSRTSNASVSSSSSKSLSYTSRNPGPLRINSSQPMSSARSAHPVTRVDDPRSPRNSEDSCGLMPITPPPTPVLNSDSSATIVSDARMC